jgi:N-6 DNA Methylase
MTTGLRPPRCLLDADPGIAVVPEPRQTLGGVRAWRDRRSEMLFIDTRKLGSMVDRTHREFADADIARIAGIYHAWRGEPGAGEYVDFPRFCASVRFNQMAERRYVLTPSRYVGAEDVGEDGEPLDEKIARLTRSSTRRLMRAIGYRRERDRTVIASSSGARKSRGRRPIFRPSRVFSTHQLVWRSGVGPGSRSSCHPGLRQVSTFACFPAEPHQPGLADGADG